MIANTVTNTRERESLDDDDFKKSLIAHVNAPFGNDFANYAFIINIYYYYYLLMMYSGDYLFIFIYI